MLNPEMEEAGSGADDEAHAHQNKAIGNKFSFHWILLLCQGTGDHGHERLGNDQKPGALPSM